MLQGLIDLVKKHRDFLQHHPQSRLDWSGMLNAKTIRDFDQAAIVGKPNSAEDKAFLHFPTVDAYYTASSAKHYTHRICRPTLTINSEDDHISSVMSVPTDLSQIGSGMAVLRTANGSHVSFSDACWKAYGVNSTWSDRAAAAWLAASYGLAL